MESEELRRQHAHRESERLQREKWESVCKQLRLDIQRYRERIFCDERDNAMPGMVEAIGTACRSIDELGFRERLQQNAKRIEKFLMSGTLSAGEIGYLKDVLRLHLLLIRSMGKTSEQIAVARDEAGMLSPSACEDLRIDLWHYEYLVHWRQKEQMPAVEQPIVGGDIASQLPPPPLAPDFESQAKPTLDENSPTAAKPFTDGELAFYEDRVELCGVDICSGARSRSRRITLELLAKKDDRGQFVCYGGDDLEIWRTQ